ncbi:MAG: VOC family protein [Vicingaceae bacterium]
MIEIPDIFKESALTSILVVQDLKKSIGFYRDVLGASLYREYGGDSAVFEFLSSWILLVSPGEPTEDKPDTRFITPPDPNGVSHAFTIRVQNCRESYRELLARGAKFITPPLERGAETRCFFRDPDGHLFEISEYRTPT